MSGADSGAYFRGIQLRQLGRHEDAEAFFREAIAHDTGNSDAYAQLALCLMEIEGRKKDAVTTVDEAIALEPEMGYYHAIKATALCQLDKGDKALEAAELAVALDPSEPMHHAVLAHAQMVRQRWKDAETAARSALAIDGDYGYAQNILASVLRIQGKLDENELAVDQLLSKDPEDEMAHVNAGYSALHRHDHAKAEEHFREALRLDPEFEGAREGLVESFRARSGFYRQYLRYCFFMQRFTQGRQWMFIIGIYLVFRLGRAVLHAVHPAAAVAFVFVYLTLVLWTFLARGVGNFLIYCDRSARLALKPREKLEGLFVGGALLGGICMLVLSAFGGGIGLVYLGATLALGTVPASLFFPNDSPRGRLVFGGVFACVYGVGTALTIASALHPEGDVPETLLDAGIFALLATMICTWLANVPALRR